MYKMVENKEVYEQITRDELYTKIKNGSLDKDKMVFGKKTYDHNIGTYMFLLARKGTRSYVWTSLNTYTHSNVEETLHKVLDHVDEVYLVSVQELPEFYEHHKKAFLHG